MATPIPEDAFCVQAGPLEVFTTEVFKKLNVPSEDAAWTANCLVGVDLRGVSSHGTRQLRRYVPEFREGLVNTRSHIRVVNDTPVSAVLDGDDGAGYLVATRKSWPCGQ